MSSGLRDDLIVLSRAIHATPELAYQERQAVANIVRLLRKHGHQVELPYGGLETAFRARAGPPGPSVVILAEYDALPEVGHGCGHNLIAMSTVGAFLLAASEAKHLQVGIELIGTPAEESGGGKIDLIDAGVFEQTVAALFAHPGSGGHWSVSERLLGISAKRVIFEGLASHAAISPEKGLNALSGLIALFNAVDGWRQHLPPATTRVHGIIREGGAAQNIIPSRAVGEFGLRSADMGTLRDMVATFTDMARGAAMKTRTTVTIEEQMRPYLPVDPNPVIGGLLAAELERRGKTVGRDELVAASGDIGNVSQRVPADYIGFPVSAESVPGHSHAMREASVTDLAHENAMLTAEVLASVAVRIATDPAIRAGLRAG